MYIQPQKKTQYPNLQEFSFAEIKAATKNFSHDNKLGEGGYGPVYKVLFSCSSMYYYVLSYPCIQSFTTTKNKRFVHISLNGLVVHGQNNLVVQMNLSG